MIPDCLYIYGRDRLNNIEQHYNDSARHGGVDAIHDLRVEIKRLRALFKLIEFTNDEFSYKTEYKPLKPLFKSAGKVRDLQVQMETIHKAINDHSLEMSEYYNYLKWNESQKRIKYLKYCKEFDISITQNTWHRINNSLRFLDRDYIADSILTYFNDTVADNIQIKESKFLEADDYHQIRIGAKAARYILEVLRKCVADDNRYSDLNDGLKAIHQVLGIWHDKDVGLDLLNDYLENHTPKELFDRRSYEKYSDILKTERAENLGIFEQRWDHFSKLLEIHGYDFS